ncbi:dialkylrecorsinol condensing enzyme DarA [Mangrovimonas futianensis]|uniref:dialkylrecorsinol condensing enzyme DarA n=1 Tax=Mangrovimonas futianensis TaxID=2895523 RepID=UPI001E423056|nr:dialkylrecorsinol condensing enzyme DarA [Mangrovimonas futianensis]MCF1421075.1 dialkylresorcinol condensing enzyme DarA [Mangrovimonas futianensis]
MKHVLVIHFSQSGQLTEIVNNVVTDLKNHDQVQIDYHQIEMEDPFPFPWSREAFYGAFPDTYSQKPRAVKPVSETILNTSYDLIILGYQIWYLTPSLPTISFLATDDAKKLFKNTPVVTVIGCRNLWMMAQEKMKVHFTSLKAQLVGNIALVDHHLNHISVITIAQWMFSGEKKKYLGIFPKPGVQQKDIDHSVRFSKTILNHLLSGDFSNLQPSLLKQGAVSLKSFLILTDQKGNKIFSKWSQIILRNSKENTSKRRLLVKMFSIYLLFAIWVISPIVFILFLLTYLPLQKRYSKQKSYYSSVALNGE